LDEEYGESELPHLTQLQLLNRFLGESLHPKLQGVSQPLSIGYLTEFEPQKWLGVFFADRYLAPYFFEEIHIFYSIFSLHRCYHKMISLNKEDINSQSPEGMSSTPLVLEENSASSALDL
jgi:hypothetical protein